MGVHQVAGLGALLEPGAGALVDPLGSYYRFGLAGSVLGGRGSASSTEDEAEA